MYFLIGIGTIIIGLRLCDNFFKKYINLSAIQGYTVKCVLFYHKLQLQVNRYFNQVYMNNELIHHLFDLCANIYLNTYSYVYDVRVLPYENCWISTHIMYSRELRHMSFIINKAKPLFYNDLFPINSEYDIISFNKNMDLTNMIIENKLSNYKKNEKMSTLIVKQLFVLKYDNKFFCTHTKENLHKQWHSMGDYTMNPFFTIEYKDSDNFTTEIDLPKSFFIENNEILSNIFIKYWLEQQPFYKDVLFDNNYTLTIIDSNFNNVSINPNQYIILENNSYRIETLK